MEQRPIAPAKDTAASRGRDRPSLTVGQYAHQVIAKQYQRMVEQEVGVLADEDPEYLHQMRVGSRRLRAALQVFCQVVKLPKSAREQKIRDIAQTLGRLRDLDVQIADIQADYGQRVNGKAEQKVLRKTLVALQEQRVQVFAEVSERLKQPAHQKLKQAYETWLRSPRFTAIAELPLQLVLPDLLNPLIAKLLLHPGWLISVDDTATASRRILHDLRKVCKHVRYQAEFFSEFYGSSFQDWIDELKTLQDNLGIVQDIYVFSRLLAVHQSSQQSLPELHQAVAEKRYHALVDWETLRHRYLNPDFRHHLYKEVLRF